MNFTNELKNSCCRCCFDRHTNKSIEHPFRYRNQRPGWKFHQQEFIIHSGQKKIILSKLSRHRWCCKILSYRCRSHFISIVLFFFVRNNKPENPCHRFLVRNSKAIVRLQCCIYLNIGARTEHTSTHTHTRCHTFIILVLSYSRSPRFKRFITILLPFEFRNETKQQQFIFITRFCRSSSSAVPVAGPIMKSILIYFNMWYCFVTIVAWQGVFWTDDVRGDGRRGGGGGSGWGQRDWIGDWWMASWWMERILCLPHTPTGCHQLTPNRVIMMVVVRASCRSNQPGPSHTTHARSFNIRTADRGLALTGTAWYPKSTI